MTATLESMPLRCFTVDEYDRMIATGILREGERVELLEGRIITMAAIGSRHAACIDTFTRRFVGALGDSAWVRIQNPITLRPLSEPEPDIVLARPREGGYLASHPLPEDVLLVIEVAESSLAYDRDIKLPRYAAAGISEVWIVDLEGDRLLTYREPRAGRYQHADTLRRGDVLSPLAFPELKLALDDILP